MNDKITKRKLIINKILTFLGLILLIASLSLAIYDMVLEQRAVSVNATIITLEYDSHNNALVRYKVEDQTYEQKIKIPKNTNLSVKDQTKIKYDMYDPNKLIYNNHEIIIAILILTSIIILVISLPKFVSNTKNKHRINKLFKYGIYINANITDVFVNSNGKKVKKVLPYRLRCKYLNPTDNKEYIFESEDTYVNPSSIINEYNTKTVAVLVDKNNSKNYYVDLNSLAPKINIIDPKAFMSQKEEKTED